MRRLRMIALGVVLSIVAVAALAARTSAPEREPTPEATARATSTPGAPPSTAHGTSRGSATAGPETNAPPPSPAVATRTLAATLAATVSSTARALEAAARDDRVAYAAALRARDAGAYDYAVAVFGQVTEGGGLLAPVAGLRLAQALVSGGHRVAAADAFEAVLARTDFPDVLVEAAHFDAADNAAARGDPGAALVHLDAVRNNANASASDRASAAHEASRIRHDAGDPAWVDDALNVVTLLPWSYRAREALDSLDAADVGVPPLAAAYVRYRGFDNDAARSGYEHALESAGQADAALAWFYLGALDERDGEDSAALTAYARSIALAPDGPLADDARYWRARIFEDRDDMDAAISEYDRLAADYPASSFTPQARLRAATWLALAGGGARGAEALERFRQITRSGSPSAAAEAARWHTVFRHHLGLGDTPALDPRTFDATGLPALVAARFAPEASDTTLTLPDLAYAESLMRPTDQGAIAAWMAATFALPAEPMPPALSDERYLLGRELMYVGEGGVSRALYLELLRKRNGRAQDLLTLSRAFGSIGMPDMQMNAADRMLGPLSDIQLVGAPRSIIALSYPIAFDNYLVQSANFSGVPPLLLAALVRQESAWNASAISSADAFGLTQVTAPTGALIADALGLDWDQVSLFEPATALQFGAFYLGTQLETFDGNVAAAVAAYNAGPGSSARWLNAAPMRGIDGFRLVVDFSETARFISRVLENYAWYRYIYAGIPAPALP